MADTGAEIRRDHGLIMTSLGMEKSDKWLDIDKNGHGGEVLAHLLLGPPSVRLGSDAAVRDLVRLFDAAGA
ncbi:hypothetical protein [Streptomyces adelaidensis]|uniref:hypothetical protein n=1 Tax=Streptomyces adelaidensis TaxID=2796465 RepID=UPI001907454C|nr:hypothetical protein [Streptomyces adelaidensis]